MVETMATKNNHIEHDHRFLQALDGDGNSHPGQGNANGNEEAIMRVPVTLH
jgi:hypothetical protein